MKDIKAISIATENCELFHFDAQDIGCCEIENIRQVVRRIACNSISEYYISDKVVLELYKNDEDNSENVFERLAKYNDITSITLIFDDGSEQDIFVVYEETSDNLGAPNTLQYSHISKLGNLYITIGYDICLNEYIEDIDNEETINFIRSMIND